MGCEIIWSIKAVDSYQNGIDFIYLKWNYKVVPKFSELVIDNLNRFMKNAEIGIFTDNYQISYLVISKQTTIYYDVDKIKNCIYLITFWNNLKNPNDFQKLL